MEGENGKIRLRKRSNVQGLTHLTLFLPFQLNGSKKTDNRRRKPRHSPTTTRDGLIDGPRSWISHVNLIVGIFILGSSVFARVYRYGWIRASSYAILTSLTTRKCICYLNFFFKYHSFIFLFFKVPR